MVLERLSTPLRQTDRWLSGLRHRFRKPASGQLDREFESPPLRPYKNKRLLALFLLSGEEQANSFACVGDSKGTGIFLFEQNKRQKYRAGSREISVRKFTRDRISSSPLVADGFVVKTYSNDSVVLVSPHKKTAHRSSHSFAKSPFWYRESS